jgi:uncharacterized protein (DUF1330 family)
MTRFGGRVIAVSQPVRRVLEGEWAADLLVLHRWDSERGFEEFWASSEYEPIKELRLRACESRIVVFPGLLDGVPAGTAGS